jgi:hypothetical protein
MILLADTNRWRQGIAIGLRWLLLENDQLICEKLLELWKITVDRKKN